MTQPDLRALEAELWGAADDLRANSKLTVAQGNYKGADPEDTDKAENVIPAPPSARWSYSRLCTN